MRFNCVVFAAGLLISSVASHAAGPVVVSGHRCQRQAWNVQLRTYPDGALRSCYLDGAQVIDDVPCASLGIDKEMAVRERGGTSTALFYPDGRLKQCLAAESFTRGDRAFARGEVVRLDPDGGVADPPSGPFAIVYPTLIRTGEGTMTDTGSRDRIAATMREKLGVDVRTSDRTLIFKLPDTSQWDLLQAGIDSFATQFSETAPEPAFFHVVFEYLIGQTRGGGETVAGIEIYVLEPSGFGDRSAVINSHYPGFNLTSRSPRNRAELIDRATKFLLRDLREGFRTELSSYRAMTAQPGP